jgi:hypothetical protein
MQMQNKIEERFPFMWGMVVFVVVVTALILWHWHVS